MPEAIMQGRSLITKTKTKTRTKVGVVALALFIGTGMMAGIGTLLSSGMVCNVGSRAGLTCRTNLDCRVRSTDITARCVGAKTLPDLTTRIYTVAERVSPSEDFYVLGEIQNQGLTPAWFPGSTTTEQVKIANIEFLSVDGTVLGSGSVSRGVGLGLSIAPRNREILRWTLSNIPTGTTALRITADPDNRVIEINETNNSSSGNIRLPSPSVSQVRFTLHPASPAGAWVPGYSEVLRFNVIASGGDVFVQNMQIGATGRDGAGTRWSESDSFRNNWRLYDTNDLTSPIGTVSAVGPIRWDGSTLWLTSANLSFSAPGLLIPSGTAKVLVLRADTTGASPRNDDTVRFDVQTARWWTGSGTVNEAIGAFGAPLVIGNGIIY